MPDTITPVTPVTKGQVAYDASDAIVLTGQAQRALANATDFTVDSDEMLEAAGDDLRKVKVLQKSVEDKRTSITVPLNAALKAINDLFRPAGNFLADAEKTLKGAMLTYTTEQARKAEAARRAAEELARQERVRIAAEQARQEQIARDAAQAAQAAAREAAEAAARGDAQAAAAAQEQARAQSEAAEQANAEAQAAAVTADVVSMPVAFAQPARVRGISTSQTVDFVVEDLMALIKHIVANPNQIDLVVVDMVKLRAQVRATGLKTDLPGVRVFNKSTMAARRA